MKTQSTCLAGLLLLISVGTSAQWVETNGPSSGTVMCLATSGAKLFAGSSGGVFLSTNKGTNWTAVKTGLPSTTVYSLFANGSDLFAGTNSGVYLSTNDGTNWKAANAGLTTARVYAFVARDTNLFVGTSRGVFLSTDTGTTWLAVNGGLTSTDVRALVLSGTDLHAGTAGGGVFLSTDNGASWTERSVGLSKKDVRSLALIGTNVFAGTFGGGVFRSTDGGMNWTSANSGLWELYVQCLAVSGIDLFAGTWAGGVFLSSDGGVSWTPANAGLSGTNVYALALDDSNLYAGASTKTVWRREFSEMHTPVHISPSFSGVCSLDGSGDRVEVPDAPTLRFGKDTSFTVELWFKKKRDWVFNLVNKEAQGVGWMLDLGYNQTSSQTIYLWAIHTQFGAGLALIQNSFGIYKDTWCHMAIVVNRSLDSTDVYVDREDQAHYEYGFRSWPSADYNVNADGMCLAVGGRPNTPASADWFDGEVDEVRVWNTARSKAQIQATMHDTLGSEYLSTADSGLVLYLRFDQLESLGIGGEGRDVRDLSAARNHGAMKGDARLVSHVGESADLNPGNIYKLLHNYPNPFNPSTTIAYVLSRSSHVTLSVFDVLGREVAVLVNDEMDAGYHEATFDASHFSSGMYLYRLQSGDFVSTMKMLLVR
ncbi:MAG: hypothetical protein H6Q31_388 [Bacteroidetes bacterium]|nr:hypothetical protein [Bacteroidota bacterium]